MRTDYIDDQDLELVLALLMPQNRLICQLAMVTGLRIGDVVAIRTDQLKSRMTVRESKTKKSRRVSIPKALLERIRAQAGPVWAFPGASDSAQGHKTRQAVWADVKRAQKAMRLPANIGPHSLRKVYAVRKFKQTGDLDAVAKALNHDDTTVTLIYAMADHLTKQRKQEGTRRRNKAR